ncbi:hypothetical protein T4A_7064 [Trichinella pseudospiralis]|uniref:Uncharacterized protein n=1 Tax=Trichinella pseudospiralis TaxID=6337 RepID=A0A0V1E601_TRIPS|nr:hypothetical protein T4A_7064 [Trichinella pseudospiralis]
MTYLCFLCKFFIKLLGGIQISHMKIEFTANNNRKLVMNRLKTDPYQFCYSRKVEGRNDMNNCIYLFKAAEV